MSHPQRIILLTGASRGLGAQLAEQLLTADTLLISIGRRTLPQLATLAQQHQTAYQEWILDLASSSDLTKIPALMQQLPKNATSYWLINNAGSVDPIASVSQIDVAEMHKTFHINTIAPMALCQAFCQHLADIPVERKILNISSGAGRSPMAGWGVYCATKAALDRFSEVIHAEQAATGVQVVSLAPGIIDTDMQATIRSSSAQNFPAVERFQALKETQQLSTPKAVAEKIVRYLAHPTFGQKILDDIREFH